MARLHAPRRSSRIRRIETADELAAHDLVPFSALAQQDVPVMVGHIEVTALDDLPATLSARTTGLLRDTAGPDVLVVTDALNMGALDAAEESTGQDRSVAALAAGSDLLLMPPDPRAARAAIVQAVADGTLGEERLRDAASHVVAASLQTGAEPDRGLPAAGEGQPLAERLAAASLTSLGETCDPAVLSSGDTVRVVGGTDEHRAALVRALRTVGLRVSGQGETTVRLVEGGDYAAGQVEDGQMPGDTASGPARGAGADAPVADVAVALDVPYPLAGVEAPVELAAFGDTEAQLAAARGKPVLLDLYADWCVACKEFEKYTFSDAAVQASLANAVLLQADVTANSAEQAALLKHLKVLGLPTILFFDPAGQELTAQRVTGFMKAEAFNAHLQKVM